MTMKERIYFGWLYVEAYTYFKISGFYNDQWVKHTRTGIERAGFTNWWHKNLARLCAKRLRLYSNKLVNLSKIVQKEFR